MTEYSVTDETFDSYGHAVEQRFADWSAAWRYNRAALPPEPAPEAEHLDEPHWPGTLWHCPACAPMLRAARDTAYDEMEYAPEVRAAIERHPSGRTV